VHNPKKKQKRIYEIAKDGATRNIERKLAVLQSFVKNGIPWECDDSGQPVRDSASGARIVDFVPLNDRAFARWNTMDGKLTDYQNCTYIRMQLRDYFGVISTHGQDSLMKRPESRVLAHSLFTALRKKKREQEVNENGSDNLTRLTSERDHWKAAAESAGAFVVRALDRNQELERNVSELTRALEEARITQRDIEHQAESRDREISTLKKQLAEINRLRRV